MAGVQGSQVPEHMHDCCACAACISRPCFTLCPETAADMLVHGSAEYSLSGASKQPLQGAASRPN